MVLRDRLKVVVGVYMVRGPMGALSWHYLQYALGLARLGHDVTVVEDSDDHQWTCWDPTAGVLGTDATYGLKYTGQVLDRVGLGDRWTYYDAHGAGWTGPAAGVVETTLRDADVYVNVSGANVPRPWLDNVPRRVFVDTDPGFVQVRHLKDPVRRASAQRHNVFLTYGERFGAADCRIPDDGFPWRPTRQPVVLDAWPVTAPLPDTAFTTVLRWDSYAPVVHGELSLGMKSQSFAPFVDLPTSTSVPLEMAVGAPAPEQLLTAHGWRLRDPQVVAPDPWGFQRYVAGSAGEFTVAKHGYVATRGGWFSERSAHYLASGRAVVTQDTGFTDLLPTGEGLLSFTDRDGALAAVEQVAADPVRHGAAARDVAAAHFDARAVLDQLLEDALG